MSYSMSYTCYNVTCNVGICKSKSTLRDTSYHTRWMTGWALSYCSMRVAGCALYHKAVLHCDVTPRYAVTSLRITLSRDFSPERHPAVRHIHVNMFHQWILGCFCPAFQQLGYETDHLPPYSTQIRNVVPYIHALTHYFLYIYLIMSFSPFSCSLQLHSPRFFPSLTLCSQTPSAY
jgi:hypothetical protein